MTKLERDILERGLKAKRLAHRTVVDTVRATEIDLVRSRALIAELELQIAAIEAMLAEQPSATPAS